MSRPIQSGGAGGARTFAEISMRTGIPVSTVYDLYRRAEMKFVLAYVIRFRRRVNRPAKKLAPV